MKQNSQKLIFFLSKITCAFAMAIAVLSVNSTCCFTAYQPDVPESLYLDITHCYHDILYSYDSGGHLMDTTKSYHQAVGG